MSTELVKQEIERFLGSKEPEVLCIRGKWGTGKTYNWNTITRDLRDKVDRAGNPRIALNEYAYVSLFGLNSIREIKMQTLQSTSVRAQIGDVTNFSTLANAVSTIERGTKKTVIEGLTSIFGNRTDTAVSAMGLLTHRQIICIDDMERKGQGLSTSDVLGFISFLKEERKCKIALLLNDGALKGDDDEQFRGYLEKVVDVNLLFAPTAEESAMIAIPETDAVSQQIRGNCIALGIDNIRVIKKIVRMVRLIGGQLKDYDPRVFDNVIDQLVLFTWCHHEPKTAPTTEFLYKYGRIGWDERKDKELAEEEVRWKNLLDPYPFHHVDDFDRELIKGVRAGYFSSDAVARHAAELNSRLAADSARNAWREAWQRMRYSFRTSTHEVVDDMTTSFKANVNYMTNDNLNSLYEFCKRMNRLDKAKEALVVFIDANAQNPAAFSFRDSFYHGTDFDPELRKALEVQFDAAKPKPDLEELLIQLPEGWNTEIIAELDAYSSEDLEKVFLSYEDDELRMRMVGISDLRKVVTGEPARSSLLAKFREAMLRIGRMNPMNADRVANLWGIKEDLPEENR